MKKTLFYILAILLTLSFYGLSAIAEAATDGSLSFLATLALIGLVLLADLGIVRKLNKIVG